jgi:hypothetical protein
VQTADDVSVQDPKFSAFHDVDQSRLTRFMVYGNGNTYAVSLDDGTFTVNGASFRPHDYPLSNIRLYYCRRVQQSINLGTEEQATRVRFRIGYDAIDHLGNPIQRVMEID